MQQLQSLWKNLFLATLVGRAAKKLFFDETLGRWRRNNPSAVYDLIIAELEAAGVVFGVGQSDAETNEQEAATIQLNDEFVKFKKTGRYLHSYVGSTWEDDNAKMELFFPSGKNELNTAKRGDVEKILNRWIELATEFSDDMDTWPARLAAMKTKWKGLMDKQGGEKGDVDEGRQAADAGWQAIATVCQKFLLKLVQDFPNNPDKADVYFDTKPLELQKNTDNDNLGNANVLAKDSEGNFVAGAKIRFIGPGGFVVKTAITKADGSVMVRNLPVGVLTVTMEKLGYPLAEPESCEVLDNADIEVVMAFNPAA